MNNVITNLIVAISAFLIGLASASELGHLVPDLHLNIVQSAELDALGNVRANKD